MAHATGCGGVCIAIPGDVARRARQELRGRSEIHIHAIDSLQHDDTGLETGVDADIVNGRNPFQSAGELMGEIPLNRQ